ncbi:MAG: hypothetical protein NVSMB56_13330 [Pyrinomonadaceae bacterium]
MLLFVMLSLFSSAVYAQEKSRVKKHQIDIAYDKCMDNEKNQTTAGMVGCADVRYKSWDKELNAVYNKLMAKLSPAGKTNLKTAQLAWLKFRDTHKELYSSMQEQLQGTMYIPMFTYEASELVKHRTTELQGLFELIEQE